VSTENPHWFQIGQHYRAHHGKSSVHLYCKQIRGTVSLNRNAKGMHSCVSMATISGYIVESYVYVHNNNIQGMHCCVSIATVVTGTHHNVRLYVRGGADKSLTLQGRKQATATKLGIYLTYSPRSSVHFLACVSNFCKPLKKKIQKVVYPSRSPR